MSNDMVTNQGVHVMESAVKEVRMYFAAVILFTKWLTPGNNTCLGMAKDNLLSEKSMNNKTMDFNHKVTNLISLEWL